MGKPTKATGTWRFGVFEFDANGLELRRAGVSIKLRDQSSRILEYLLEDAGHMVTREELRQHLWPADTFVDFDHSLNTAVMKLREALGDSADKPLYIETLPKHGYRFVAPVFLQSATETQSAAAGLPTPPAPLPPRTPPDTPSLRALFRQGARLCLVPRNEAPAPPAENRHPARSLSHSWPLLRRIALLLTVLLSGLLITHVSCDREDASRAGVPSDARGSMRIVPLTSLPGAVNFPALSPDSEKIAFTWDQEDPVRSDLYVQLIGAVEPLQLTHTRTGFLCCADWSPDGREIAFGRCYDNGGGVFVVPALGGPERKLTDVSCIFGRAGFPQWTADGSSMVLADRCTPDAPVGIVLFSLTTGEKRCLDTPPRSDSGDMSPLLSPDKKTVAFLRSPTSQVAHIYAVSLSGENLHQLTDETENIWGLMWSTDGRRITFQSDRRGLPRVWRVGATGGAIEPEVVYPTTGALSRDGRRMAYIGDGNEATTIWRAELPRAGAEPVSQKRIIASASINNGTQLSPDEKQIVFQSYRSGNAEIWKSNPNGSNARQLTVSRGNYWAGTPRWSPDGRWIVFDQRPKNHSQIYLMDEEGRSIQVLTAGNYDNAVPSWSRDGAALYFASSRTGAWQVWKLELSSGKESQITRQGGFAAIEAYDGKTLYYSKFEGGGLWKTPVAGGEEQHIADSPHRGYWGSFAVTEKGLYLLDSDAEPAPAIVYYDLQTQRSKPVLTLKQDPLIWTANLAASRDGRTLFYAQGEATSSILMIEMFQ
jgi:Tol biopolymer transport system component/DNA-binding winged helix-turn-helix (wHTH) protein